ncbi:hypothetical protein GCM10009665_76370 [Kitasatospora nipponensis]|uniref:RDD domain-containing protein n=1 Tax=Kitasatospora nipponensis TaxID=258049 RepID=A0ABN1T7W8_9ACTN
MSDLVTGEAVVLGLRTAKLPSRALAVLLDLVVEFGAFFIGSLLMLTFRSDLDSAAGAAFTIGMMVLFLVAVPVMVETFTRGRSLGKLALGLRVVRVDGGPVRFRHSLVRGLVGIFEIILLGGVPAAISSLVSAEGRRLGDVFAGTLVVRERVPAGRAGGPVIAPPPQVMSALGADLIRLDLSAVPDGLWLAIRQLLSRTDQLDEQVALRMAAQLAADLAERTRWPVPPGLYPALYLGAVLTERQRREWLRASAATPSPYPTAPTPWSPTPPSYPAPPAYPAAPAGHPTAPAAWPPASATVPAATPAPVPAPRPTPTQPPAPTGQPALIQPPPVLPPQLVGVPNLEKSTPVAAPPPPAAPPSPVVQRRVQPPAAEPGGGFALPG